MHSLSIVEAGQRATIMRKRLREGPVQKRKRYVRAFVTSVVVGAKGVRMMGSANATARIICDEASVGDLGVAEVQSSVRTWRRGWDSNPRYP